MVLIGALAWTGASPALADVAPDDSGETGETGDTADTAETGETAETADTGGTIHDGGCFGQGKPALALGLLLLYGLRKRS